MIIAQLSDIHADGSEQALERLDRVLGWLKLMRADAIIVSGDLAEHAHAENYQALHDRLDAIGSAFYVVPGNVDDHHAMRQVFGAALGWVGGRPFNCTGRLGESLRVIGLDVTVNGADHGDAAPVLEWLASELDRNGPPALIFQHQHPFFLRNRRQGPKLLL